jgi:hypothetical protein
MLKNNSRFTARQAPCTIMNEKIVKLVTWADSKNTAIFMCLVSIVLTNTWLIPIVPQIIILSIMLKFNNSKARFYQIRAEKLMKGEPMPEVFLVLI